MRGTKPHYAQWPENALNHSGEVWWPGQNSDRPACRPEIGRWGAAPLGWTIVLRATAGREIMPGCPQSNGRWRNWLRMDFLRVQGARTHNLKNINLDIPKHKLVVITGLSVLAKLTRVRHTVRRGAASLRRVAVGVRAAVLQMMDKPTSI